MVMFLYHIGTFAFQIIAAIVGGVGLYRYKKMPVALRYLVWYIVFCFIVEWVKYILANHHIRTLWLSHVDNVIETFLLFQVIAHLSENQKPRIILWWSYCFYMLIWIIGAFTFEPFSVSDVYSFAVSQCIQIGFGTWFLLSMVKDDYLVLRNDARFWTVLGVMLYATATFCMFRLFNVMWKISPDVMRKIWLSNFVFIIIQHYFFLRAFLCKPLPAASVGNGGVVKTAV
jgi:hypothetical protein